MTASRCKHDWGWCNTDYHYISIHKDGSISFNLNKGYERLPKLRMRCNNPKCFAIRNIYITGKVKLYGKIHIKKD